MTWRSLLSLRIVGALALAATVLPTVPALAQNVTGSGSTFVQPLMNRWSRDFLRSQWSAESQPAGGLDYEAVGSQAGVMRIKDRAVDFGATEVPLSAAEAKQYGLVQFPVVIGGIVAAVNLPGVDAAKMRLSGELIADVYLGKITRWSDPALQALNPELSLPDAEIVPVRRSDGSGTTFAFTSFLSNASAGWRSVGAGLQVTWPAGRAAKGNDGVAETVKRTPYALGYVDFASARRAGLTGAALKNGAGTFVSPSPESFQAAASAVDWSASADARLSLAEAPGEAAYPIVAATFILVPEGRPIAARTAAVVSFLSWGLDHGSSSAVELGYVPLPAAVVDQVRLYWKAKLDLAPVAGPPVGGRT